MPEWEKNLTMTRCEATELLGTLQKKYGVALTKETKPLILLLERGHKLTIIEE